MYILSLNHTWIITKALRGHADLLYVNSIPPPRQGGTPPNLRGHSRYFHGFVVIPPPRQRRYSPYLKGREGFENFAKEPNRTPHRLLGRHTTLIAVRMALSP